MIFMRWAYVHRRSILFLIFALGLAGVIASTGLPVGLFPTVAFPRVVVSMDAGDRPADRMAIEATRPVEEAVRSVPGVRNVRSNTSRGSADVSVTFDWGTDMTAAALQIESAVNQIREELPPQTVFEVKRMDPTVFPVLGYSLTSDTRSLVELRELALYQLRPALSTVSSVARIDVQGGLELEYEVIANPEKLDSLGLTMEDVAAALSASNVLSAVGRMEDKNKLYLVETNAQFQKFEQIGETVLRSGSAGLVQLEDVAEIRKGTVPAWTRVTADGKDAVLLTIYQQPGGNTVQIAKDIEQQLKALENHLPKDVRIANWYNQGELIVSAATSVRDAVLVGILLAALILLLFLRNFKLMLIAALTVPTVLTATVLWLYALHMSFNIMTLGGMAAAVGLIIDDVIVMMEHGIRRLRESPGTIRDQFTAAAWEFTRPLAGSSASTVVIFVPLAFLTGVTGAFFKALSLTMACALVVSFLVAWLAVPLLCARLLNRRDAEQEEKGFLLNAAQRLYARLMGRLLAKPALILIGLLLLAAAGTFAYLKTGSGFMPPMDEGGFVLDYRSAPGMSLSETDRLLRQVEAILKTVPEVDTYSRRTGLQLGGGVTEANEGDFFVRLKPLPRRDIEAVMDDVREKVEHQVPGLEIEILQLMEDLIGDLTAVPQPIEIKLFSDDEALLQRLSPQVADAISTIDGVVDVNPGIVLAGDALDIDVNRQKAAIEGVSPEAVTAMLQNYLSGAVTTTVLRPPKIIGVRAWIPASERSSVEDVRNLRIMAPDGHLLPLGRIADIRAVEGQPQITRENLKQMAAVTARISNRDMGSAVKDVTDVLRRPGLLPEAVTYRLGGLYEQQRIAFRGLSVVLVAAVLLVFILLLFLYESFRVAVAMMITTLSALSAVFIGLFITHTELNISAMMGMTMVVGIVTEVAILYFSEVHTQPPGTPPMEALILAGQHRMRPILMTTLAAVLALSPLALGLGQGSAMQKPLAIAIISGLAIQLVLVLTVLPAILKLLGVGKTTHQ